MFVTENESGAGEDTPADWPVLLALVPLAVLDLLDASLSTTTTARMRPPAIKNAARILL